MKDPWDTTGNTNKQKSYYVIKNENAVIKDALDFHKYAKDKGKNLRYHISRLI